MRSRLSHTYLGSGVSSWLTGSAFVLCQLLGVGMAQAQVSSTGTAAATEEALEEIVVTGSRIAGASTYTSPTPVTSIDAVDLLAAAPSTLAEGLKQLPSIVPGGGPTVGGGTGNSSANFLNLRGLGNGRTLTLLDGRRFAPSGPTGNVDSNLIPQGLVQRVDVVTGGASAAYGSDAVGGVINFVLDKKFTGLKGDVAYGMAQEGDNKEAKLSVTFGTDYLGGRAHFIASGEYYDNKGVAGDARDFRTTARNQLVSPANANLLVGAADIRSRYTTGGVILVGAGGTTANNQLISGTMFGPGGVPQAYDYGLLTTNRFVAGGFQDGGSGFRVSTGQEIVRPLERKTLFARTDFALNDNLNLFVEGSYGESLTDGENSPTTHTVTIRRANPYLAQVAPALVTQMTTFGVTTFTMNRLTLERGPTVSHAGSENLRGLVGLDGNFGEWTWEASYQWGSNDLLIPVTNNLITANMSLAADASDGDGRQCGHLWPGDWFNCLFLDADQPHQWLRPVQCIWCGVANAGRTRLCHGYL